MTEGSVFEECLNFFAFIVVVMKKILLCLKTNC